MKLILWDIDGTIVNAPAGEKAIGLAFKEATGKEGSIHDVDYRGRTDRFIARALFEKHGLPADEAKHHAFLELYFKHLAEGMTTAMGKTTPGIVQILEAVRKRDDLAQGLLTGNMRKGAQIKLEPHKVWHYFEFGAFADDSHIRNDLGPFALQRAKDRHGRAFDPKDVFIVGDTEHDIACAKIIGANSIAVATGHFTAGELEKHHPTALLQDLGDPAAFFAVIDAKR